MSENKKKIAALHRKAENEKRAKEEVYRLAVTSIKTYLQAIDKAGKLLDAIKKEYESNISSYIIDQTTLLMEYDIFFKCERNIFITFREYLERRKSCKFLTYLFKRMFKEQYNKRFDKGNEFSILCHEGFDESLTTINDKKNKIYKEVQKFHILQDILSETKTTEAVMLQKYNLRKEELLSIIEVTKKELRGIDIQPAPTLKTEPIGETKVKS